MMTTSAAEKRAAGDKGKVEKRRALGRGLESLLPGPRVVTGGQSGGAAGKQQIPHFVRNDKTSSNETAAVGEKLAVSEKGAVVWNEQTAVSDHAAVAERADVIHAASLNNSGGATAIAQAASRFAALEIQAVVEEDAVEAELRSAGQPGAAVPTFSGQDFPTENFSQVGADETITQAESRIPGSLVVNVVIADIDRNPFQTRHVEDDEALEELANSIKANGVVQPIMVRPSDEEEGRYILILGERRLHASKKAGKTHIPALVRRVSLQQAAEMTIIENLQREDLSALEQAEAFRVLSNEFHLTQQQIGERVGLSRASVTNYMRLLKLPREVMQLLAEKKINFAQAKELLKLEGDDKIAEAALFAVKKGMSVEQVEMLVLRMNGLLDPIPGMPGQEPKKSSGARWVDPNVRAAQLDLERMLGVRVRIRDRKGKGKIVIEYHTVDDYERVVEMLRGKK
jgi:ParB family transcriptional regulator, chromosome partitioning protein